MVLLRTIAGCAQLTATGVIVRSCAVAAIFELITILFRFGLGIQSTRDTAFIGGLTFGIRIHHGYIGLLLMLIAAGVLRKDAGPRHFLMIVGIALLVSDLVHHFVVLWPATGSPQFDLVYPVPGSGAIP